MSSREDTGTNKSDRMHSETRESVDAVLERMCLSIGVKPELRGYAAALDISPDTIKTWRRRGEVSLRFLAKFSAEHSVNLHYLKYGEVQNEPVAGSERVTYAALAPAEVAGLQQTGMLQWRDVLVIVLDALNELGKTLPGNAVLAVVDAVMAWQRAGISVQKATVMEQLRLVK
jgi:hypothetical protein